MSFELSSKASLKAFINIIRACASNCDKTTLLFDKNEIYLFQNLYEINDNTCEKLSLIVLLKRTFFSDSTFPKIPNNALFAVELTASKILRNLLIMRKKLTSIVFEFPVFTERSSNNSQNLEEIDFLIHYFAGNSFTIHQKLKLEVLVPPSIKFVHHALESFRNCQFWKKVLVFNCDNMVKLSEFKNLFLSIIMRNDYVTFKQADVPIRFILNVKGSKFIDYSNDVCMKDFEGRTQLELSANYLINYMQLCREAASNPGIFLSKTIGGSENHRMMLSLTENDGFEIYCTAMVLLIKSQMEDNAKNPFFSAENKIRDEFIDEEEEVIDQESKKSLSEIDPNDLDRDLGLSRSIPALEPKQMQIENEQKQNLKSSSAINYFGFLNEEARNRNQNDGSNHFIDVDTRSFASLAEFKTKITKRKESGSLELDNHEFKKIKGLGQIKNPLDSSDFLVHHEGIFIYLFNNRLN